MAAQPPSWDGMTVRANRADADRVGDSQASLGGLHMAGVFNGVSNVTVSHRARIPAIFNRHVRSPGLHPIGAALDLRAGVLRNRTTLRLPGICTATLEHVAYAHRTRMHLMVMELVVTDLVLLGDISAAGCSVSLTSFEQLSFDTTPDFTFDVVNTTLATMGHSRNCVIVAAGTTKLAEVAGVVNVTSVGLAWDAVPDTMVLTANGTTIWLGVARSSIEADLHGSSATTVAAAASAMLADIRSVPAVQLLAEHTAGWATLWGSGVEVTGDQQVARAINASLYYILSAIRPDFHFGLSPGGLATNSCENCARSSRACTPPPTPPTGSCFNRGRVPPPLPKTNQQTNNKTTNLMG